MKTLRSVSAAIALGSALLLGGAAVAEAGTITTAPLFIAGTLGDVHACELANVTAVGINLTIESIDSAGTVVNSSGLVLVPGGVSIQVDFFAATDEQFRCRFSATDSNGIRVSINRFRPPTGSVADLNGYGEIR
jgi:hypothetical protein